MKLDQYLRLVFIMSSFYILLCLLLTHTHIYIKNLVNLAGTKIFKFNELVNELDAATRVKHYSILSCKCLGLKFLVTAYSNMIKKSMKAI